MENRITEIKQKNGESRANYLIRVAVAMLRESGYNIEPIHYDGTECDAFCLAEDLIYEFEIEEQ